MEHESYSTARQIRALVSSVGRRALRGHYDYDKDMRTVQKYRDQAQALNDPALEAQIANVLAIMNSFSGFFNKAIEQHEQNLEIYRQTNDINGMVLSVNNLAAMHRKVGMAQEAMSYYDQGTQLVAEVAGQVEPHEISSFPQLLAGKLVTLVILGRYDEAQQVFDEVEAVGEKLDSGDRLTYSRTMTYAYRGRAEIELSQQQVDEAKATIKRALELAELLNLTFELAEVRLVQAHIAALGESNMGEAESFWKMAEEIVTTTPVTFNTGCLFAEESRYLRRAGQNLKADYFARIATDLLNKTPTPEVEQIIQSLSA